MSSEEQPPETESPAPVDPEAQAPLPGHELGERPIAWRARQEEVLVKVSRREKDEIDFVMDAMRIFVTRVRAASRPLLALGVLLILLGVSLAGWPQAALGQDRSGYWYVAAVDHGSLARYTIDGDYPDFAPGDTFLLQGNIESIEYYAPLEESGWPQLVPAPQAADGTLLANGSLESLFGQSSNAAANYSSARLVRQQYFSNLSINGFLFNEVGFEDVVFENVVFEYGFFINCDFERVAFYNVTIRGSVLTHVMLSEVLLQNSVLEEARLEHAAIDRMVVRSTVWEGTSALQSNLRGIKFDHAQLTNGSFQRSQLDVVLFQQTRVTNFTLLNSPVTNVVDGEDLGYTYMVLRGATVRAAGNLEQRLPVGASIYMDVTVIAEGGGAGSVANSTWVAGNVTGAGFTTPFGEQPVNLSRELLVVEPKVVQPTFWWSVGFNTFVLAGAMLLVYAVGGPAVILTVTRFSMPILATAGGFLLLFLAIPTRDFLLVSQLMLLYFVPPLGKGTVIPLGIAAGINPWVLALATAFVDIMVGVFLAWNFDLARKIPFVGGAIRRVQAKGHEIMTAQPWIERLAFAGIMLFVMFPFQGSGSVGGTLLGRSMSMSPNRILSAVAIGGVLGSFIISASIVFGLGLAGQMGTYGLLIALVVALIIVTLWYTFRHWDELSLDEFQEVLGLHREGIIGAPVGAAADLAGAATLGVFRAVEGTGQVISKTTATVLDAFMPEGAQDQPPANKPEGDTEDEE